MINVVRRTCSCVFLLLVASFACAQETTGLTGLICGSVLDENSAPASHVYVIAMSQGPSGHSGGYPGTFTDETGRYCVDGFGLGKYVMSTADEKKGYPIMGPQFYTEDSPGPQVTLTAQNPEARVDWQIPFKAGFLRLQVSLNHPGVESIPITFDLVVRSRPKVGTYSVMTSLKTGPKASITILLPPHEDVMLTVMAPGYRRWPDDERGQLLNLRPGETENVTIPLVEIAP